MIRYIAAKCTNVHVIFVSKMKYYPVLYAKLYSWTGDRLCPLLSYKRGPENGSLLLHEACTTLCWSHLYSWYRDDSVAHYQQKCIWSCDRTTFLFCSIIFQYVHCLTDTHMNVNGHTLFLIQANIPSMGKILIPCCASNHWILCVRCRKYWMNYWMNEWKGLYHQYFRSFAQKRKQYLCMIHCVVFDKQLLSRMSGRVTCMYKCFAYLCNMSKCICHSCNTVISFLLCVCVCV